MWYERINPLTDEKFIVNAATNETSNDFTKLFNARFYRNVVILGQSSAAHTFTSDRSEYNSSTSRMLSKLEKFSAKEVDDLETLYGIVDLIIRFKYLTLPSKNQDSYVTSQLQSLSSKASTRYGINDLDDLVKRSEKAIVLNRTQRNDSIPADLVGVLPVASEATG
jgi:hypothetical protein